MSEARFFVFRINYGENFGVIRNDIIYHGLLRQGWGAEGMDITNNYNTFKDAWIERWHEEITDKTYKKYKNLQIMKEIKKGDFIIIPKVSVVQDGVCDSFTLAVCDKEYSFAVLEDKNDFGHIIGIKEAFSCCYKYDHNSSIIAKSFRSYQSSLNNVWDEKVTRAVTELIEQHKKQPRNFEENNDLITIVSNATRNERQQYLRCVKEKIRDLKAHDLENIIAQLFEKNGYHKLRANWYDKEGGDIDIVFETFGGTSLMGNIYDISDLPTPRILVQAKNKKLVDADAVDGVNQLIKMDQDQIEEKNAIKILINLTDEFPPEVIELARNNDIILLDGMQFASLLVRYGIDVE